MSFSYTYLRRSSSLFVTTLILVISLILRALLPATTIEQYYSRGIFPFFRQIWDHTIALLPIPLFYLFWFFVLAQVLQLFRAAKRVSPPKWKKRLLLLGRKLYVFLAWIVICFLWMWGFNYGRVSVEASMQITPRALSLAELRQRVFSEANNLATIRASMVGSDTAALSADLYPSGTSKWENAIRPGLQTALARNGYPAPGKVRGRQLWPPGLLLRWSTAGVYWPWIGEGNIDAGLHHLQKPAVLAHEMAHGYGFGDEGSCNFWAYLAGLELTEAPLRYAIRLSYWRRLAARLRRADPAGYQHFLETQLDAGMINDLRAIYANNLRYPDLMPKFRDATYNAYLRAQGIEEGMLNYGRVVMLVEGYRKR